VLLLFYGLDRKSVRYAGRLKALLLNFLVCDLWIGKLILALPTFHVGEWQRQLRLSPVSIPNLWRQATEGVAGARRR
jgi:hypothetical protein